ncbi:protein of unknown function [Arenibacter nanhaiticus]|uniref:Acyl-coenzyme A thioesterase PaaI, contains HGG motif n=1 Tax=Arenibacter nanhaiticus TaxID=558155 RepID=A0A1M6E5Q1_9FLAO|nr:DUF4442 domain-containing protein [Arenibacter nanhaiticus]SHI80836.1 protein of unknown function [Arenibacter nanhaiticus]
MAANASKFNTFTFFKLPSAWWCGVRLRHLDEQKAVVTVRHRWINQNPFKSMFWAVQGMAAELSTGALVISRIKSSGKNISMLVANNKASFTKKATGKITFSCEDGHLVQEIVEKAAKTGEGQTLWMTSVGKNEEGVVVSTFNFEWTLKVKE